MYTRKQNKRKKINKICIQKKFLGERCDDSKITIATK